MDAALTAGTSFAEIGRAVGIIRQAAHRRFGAHRTASVPDDLISAASMEEIAVDVSAAARVVARTSSGA